MSKPLNHILCIDDEPDILEVVQLCLETLGGMQVTCLNQSSDALSAAQAVKPDLILIDVMMPEMDGPTTLSALKATSDLAHIPVVFMTARVQPAEVAQYMALGAAGVVPKPFDPMQLANQVLALWGKTHD